MILYLKAKHFIDTHYAFGICAIEKAARDQFKIDNVLESVDELRVGVDKYKHPAYFFCHFDEDKKKAVEMQPNDIVREINLTCFIIK